MVIPKDAIKILEQLGRAALFSPGPIAFTDVGDKKVSFVSMVLILLDSCY